MPGQRPSAAFTPRTGRQSRSVRRRGLQQLAFLVLGLCAACSGARLTSCGQARKLISERSGASRAGQTGGVAPAKPKSWRPPKRDKSSTWRTLSSYLPDNVEGFRARMGRDGRDIDVGATQPLLTVRRSYAGKDGVILDLELIDTSASPRLRELFGRTRELVRDNDRAVFKALKVQGQRAFTQWLDASKSARTSVLVAERFLLNVDTKPVTSPALGMGVAQKLDIPGLVALASNPVLGKPVVDAGTAAGDNAAADNPAPPSAAAESAAPDTQVSDDSPGEDPGLDNTPP